MKSSVEALKKRKAMDERRDVTGTRDDERVAEGQGTSNPAKVRKVSVKLVNLVYV
jgi:hypothetical protein